MHQTSTSGTPSIISDRLRQLAEQDRDVMEKGVKAFVSYVRAYKEHHCKFIFRITDLDLAQLGTAFGLLRLPKMPELRKAAGALASFKQSPVNPDIVKVQACLATKAGFFASSASGLLTVAGLSNSGKLVAV